MKIHRFLFTTYLLFLLPKFAQAVTAIPDSNYVADKVFVQLENILHDNNYKGSITASENKRPAKYDIKTIYSAKIDVKSVNEINQDHLILEALNILESTNRDSKIQNQGYYESFFRHKPNLFQSNNLYVNNNDQSRNFQDLILFNFFYPYLFVTNQGHSLTNKELIVSIKMSMILLKQAESNQLTNNLFINQVDKLWGNIYGMYENLFSKSPCYFISDIKSKNIITYLILNIGNRLAKLHERTYYTDNYNSEKNYKVNTDTSVKTDFKRYDILVVK